MTHGDAEGAEIEAVLAVIELGEFEDRRLCLLCLPVAQDQEQLAPEGRRPTRYRLVDRRLHIDFGPGRSLARYTQSHQPDAFVLLIEELQQVFWKDVKGVL